MVSSYPTMMASTLSTGSRRTLDQTPMQRSSPTSSSQNTRDVANLFRKLFVEPGTGSNAVVSASGHGRNPISRSFTEPFCVRKETHFNFENRCTCHLLQF